jgi:hypothetical protein
MAIDIVINWAAEGLVLCFMHAVVDLTPNDNDENNKTGWTNWCGTPSMNADQIQLLYGRLLVCLPHPPTSLLRVFQILANDEGRQLLMSWPPDTNHPPSGRDFATLVENARIGTATPDESGAKTSCTRRYKALQTTPSAIGGEVESIFIPHGMSSPCPYVKHQIDVFVHRNRDFCVSQGQLTPSQYRQSNCNDAAIGLQRAKL